LKKYLNHINKIFLYIIVIIIAAKIDALPRVPEDSPIQIKNLVKTGEIKDGFAIGEIDYFWRISTCCCDKYDNLYVSDRGWNKIFKFDPSGQFIISFGREGQGPGEFLATPKAGTLYLSAGNDGYIYIYDSAIRRLSIFTQNGKYVKSYTYRTGSHDQPQINSRGDIYLITMFSEENLIDIYDNNFKYKMSIFSAKYHFRFPVRRPSKEARAIMHRVNGIDIRKTITKDNHLIVLSNFSLEIFHFDEKNSLVNNFKIRNKIFLEDFKNRLKKYSKKVGFISPFNLFLDKDESLCLSYFNSSISRWEIYRYNINGSILDILRFPEATMPYMCTNSTGSFFAVSKDASQINIYKIKQFNQGGQ
jgi:hypothetical protein